MVINSPRYRLVVGLIGSTAAAALLAPTASGATQAGPAAAATHGSAVVAPAAHPMLPSVPGKEIIVVATAPVGTAGPAAPAPMVVAIDKSAVGLGMAEFGKHDVAQGYVNEQQAAWQGAGAGAAAGAGVGALGGAIAGAIIGGLFGIFGGPVGIIVGAITSGITGAITGAVFGAVGGGINGYITGQNQARAHNDAVRRNGGKPVSAAVPVRHRAGNPTGQVAGLPDVRAFLPQPTRAAHPAPFEGPREIPDVKLPPQAHHAIRDAKDAFARAFGIPIPRR
ncbi:hypothetical protein HUN08_00550 [Gordonia sp. X0973]|uniref:hypothetical protein n=1 Tax=Gordonia sp. X0973 TaxID=2742602 RepID=UPI000F52F7E8|nr:hypothetical protein [Gordonia sp. X0973]QKT05854.1 hypothetical protein HUN08_00550 [Gordonia sp. X0973]